MQKDIACDKNKSYRSSWKTTSKWNVWGMKIYDILIRPWNCLDCDSTCDHYANYQVYVEKGNRTMVKTNVLSAGKISLT